MRAQPFESVITHVVSHHVGGRGFNVALNCPGQFSDDVIHVLYEADRECAEEMIRSNPRPEQYYVVPFALGARNGSAVLNITQNPYASSLLLPDKDFNKNACEVMLTGPVDGTPMEGVYYDTLYELEHRVVRTMDIRLRTLDDLLTRRELSFNAPPDFLSLDTQGTEHDVLEGAAKCLAENVLALATEIEFMPMYTGQKLLSDMFERVTHEGFYFAGFTYLQDVATRRAPIGLRAKEFLAFGDCVFIRRIDAVRRIARSQDHLYVMLHKLAFLALVFGYLSYATEVLDAIKSLTPTADIQEAMKTRRYHQFLDKLAQCVAQFPRRYLYPDRHVLAEVRRKQLGRSVKPPAEPTLSGRRYTAAGFLRRLDRAWVSLMGGIPQPYANPHSSAPIWQSIGAASPVEALLEQHGFSQLAAEARSRRTRAEPFALPT